MNETDAAGRRTGAWEEPDPHGGTMHGEYEMRVVETDELFDAHITPFRLAVPSALN